MIKTCYPRPRPFAPVGKSKMILTLANHIALMAERNHQACLGGSYKDKGYCT